MPSMNLAARKTFRCGIGQFHVKIGLAGVLLLLFPTMLLPPAAKASHEIAPEREAWYLVRRRCVLCHYLDQPGFKFGPSLYGLFTRPNAKLINGKPVNEQSVSEQIAEGSANMPAFKYTLNERETLLIVRYLKGDFPNAAKQDGTYPRYHPRP